MEVILGQRLAVFRVDLGLIADHVRVVRQLEDLLGHTGCQIAVMTGRQIDRTEGESDRVIIDGNLSVA